MNDHQQGKIIQILNQNGMTVLLTSDYNAIGLELARLRRFERHIRLAGDVDVQLAMVIKTIDRGADALRDSLQQSA